MMSSREKAQQESQSTGVIGPKEQPNMALRALWVALACLCMVSWFGSACGAEKATETPQAESTTDTPVADASPDKLVADTPATETPTTETPGTETPTPDKSVTDTPAPDRTTPEPTPRDFPPLPPGQWPATGGGPSSDFGNDIAFDKAGNAYITGEFDESTAFGAHQLKAIAATDIFVAKLDPTGKWLWAVSAGSKGFDGAASIAVDAAGNAYVTGKIDGDGTFGKVQTKGKGFTDIFIARVNANGTWSWVQTAGAFNQDSGEGITVAPNGDILVTGMFRGNGDFGTKMLAAGPNDNLFVARLGANGTWKWAVGRNDTRSTAPGLGIASDGEGNAYITGYYAGNATFGTNELKPTGGFDTYVARVNANGTWNWATPAGSTGPDSARAIAANAAGVISIVGRFEGDLTVGATTLKNTGKKDIFVAGLEKDGGGFLWAKSFGGSSFDFGRGVAVDSEGNTFVTGSFQQALSVAGKTFQAGQSDNVVVIKLDKTGKVLWAVAGGGPKFDAGFSVSTFAGVPFVIGYFQDSATFDGTAITSKGSDDVFVWRVKAP